MIRDYGTSSLALHHIKKPSDNPDYRPQPLEAASNVQQWFLQARGARALINGTDVRLGVDRPTNLADLSMANSKDKQELALVMRGFARVRGEVPLIYLSRHSDEDGEPLGYDVVKGTNLLFNGEQEKTLTKLNKNFKFKDAQQVYGRGAQATTDFLNKCVGLGLIHKISRKEGYEKL